MRLVYKLARIIYSEVQEPAQEEEGVIVPPVTPRKGGVKWALPISPEATPKRSPGRVYPYEQTDRALEQRIEPFGRHPGALGLIWEENEEDDLTFGQPYRADPRRRQGKSERKRSLGSQVDRMKRRAQSEPLY